MRIAKKRWIIFLSVLLSLPVVMALTRIRHSAGVTHCVDYFKTQSSAFAQSTSLLRQRIENLQTGNPQSISAAKDALRQCRLHYKRIEFFLSFFFPNQALVYNSPPKLEAEEPFLEYEEPRGLQVIEALLFNKDIAKNVGDLKEQIGLVQSSAQDLHSLLYNFHADDKQVLESLRMELVRITTLNITGFDAPLLKSGLDESVESLFAVKEVLQPFLETKTASADSVSYYLNQSLFFLNASDKFDDFDRLHFLTDAALPLQHWLNNFIKENGLITETILSYDANNLFGAGALQMDTSTVLNQQTLIQLGRQLFFEKGLSGNGTRSCATCHAPEKYFTDGLQKSLSLDGHTTVQRNAPTLLYAGYQRSQFWDGRVKTLEAQIVEVLQNPMEMASVDKAVIRAFKKNNTYSEALQKNFPSQPAMSAANIATAIAAYIRTLAPFSSPFDDYIRGNHKALSGAQIRGFNLFAGKAGCATCHFLPLFNGTVPPAYKVSELEVLGTTATDDFSSAKKDDDRGRFATYPVTFYKGAFKTPTLRNVAMTGPYMHNGAFTSLEKVMEFYNKGGGNGFGLTVENQTLSSVQLHLSQKEVSDIIQFLNSLTDRSVSGKGE